MPGVDSSKNPYRFKKGEGAVRDDLAKLAGRALIWRGLELTGDKVIFLVRMLILARILSPDDFGLLAIAVTVIGFLLGITDFGMLPALVQHPTLDRRNYNAAWTVNVVRAGTVAVFIFLLAPIIAGIFKEMRATPILQVLAIRPIFDAAASIRVADLMRELRFQSLAMVKLTEGLVNTIIAVVLSFYFGVWGLVFGALGGAAAYLIMSYVVAPHSPRLLFDFEAARPLIRFGRWIFVSGLVTVCGGIVLNIVISRQLGAVQLGLYFLAARLAFLPAEVAAKVAGYVAFPIFARLQSDPGQAVRAFRVMLTGMSAVLTPFCLLILVLAPTMVNHILGPRWAGTAPVIQILVLASLIGVMGEATVPIFKGLGQPHRVTVIEAVQSLLVVVLVWNLAGRYGLVGAVLAWLPAIGVSQVCSFVFVRQILKHPFSGLGPPLLAILLASAAGAAVSRVSIEIFAGLGGFFTAATVGTLTVAVLLLVADRRLSLGLRDEFSRVFPQIACFKDWKLRSSKVKAQN
jgi:O-antigen/teichoic acid export membrane protein